MKKKLFDLVEIECEVKSPRNLLCARVAVDYDYEEIAEFDDDYDYDDDYGDRDTVEWKYYEPSDAVVCLLSILTSEKDDFRDVPGLEINEEWQKEEWKSVRDVKDFPYLTDFLGILQGVGLTDDYEDFNRTVEILETRWLDEEGVPHKVRIPKVSELGLEWSEIEEIITGTEVKPVYASIWN